MKISFHTNAFVWAGQNDIEKIADFAIDTGYTGIEMGPGFELDVEKFKRVSKRIPFSALIFCRNFIDDDQMLANDFQSQLYKRMEIASEVGAKKFITSTGISKSLSFDDGGCDPLKSLGKVTEFLGQVTRRGKELGLTICLENCPMYRNVATSPLLFREIFKSVTADNLGLCYDPAHFVWQMIDPYGTLDEFADKVFHLHLKDTEILRDKLRDVGILHNTAKEKGFEKNQWWRHTIMGDGEIDWTRFLEKCENLPSPLLDCSFEMEDFHYELDESKVKRALKIQLDRLKKFEISKRIFE